MSADGVSSNHADRECQWTGGWFGWRLPSFDGLDKRRHSTSDLQGGGPTSQDVITPGAQDDGQIALYGNPMGTPTLTTEESLKLYTVWYCLFV